MSGKVDYTNAILKEVSWVADFLLALEKKLDNSSKSALSMQEKYAQCSVETPIILAVKDQFQTIAKNLTGSASVTCLQKCLEIEQRITTMSEKIFNEAILSVGDKLSSVKPKPLTKKISLESLSSPINEANLQDGGKNEKQAKAKAAFLKHALAQADFALTLATNVNKRSADLAQNLEKLVPPESEQRIDLLGQTRRVFSTQTSIYNRKKSEYDKEGAEISSYQPVIRGFLEGLSKVAEKVDADKRDSLTEKIAQLRQIISPAQKTLPLLDTSIPLDFPIKV